MPGSQRSSMPWITANRRPRSVSSPSRSGIHGASPRTVATGGSSAARIATAPPMEKPRSKVRGAPAAQTAARASATHRSIRFHDLIRYFTSATPSSGKRGASQRTSHSIEALRVPSTSPLCPPFTHTTAVRSVGACDPHFGASRQSLQRPSEEPGQRGRSRTAFNPASASSPILLMTGARNGAAGRKIPLRWKSAMYVICVPAPVGSNAISSSQRAFALSPSACGRHDV